MKKKKAPKDIFETKCWVYDVIIDPYQVFAEMFGMADLKHFIRYVKDLLLYAHKPKVYTEVSPVDVLLDTKVLRSLIRAAHALREKKNGPVKVEQFHITDKNLYCGRYLNNNNEWNDFPRSLSHKDFCNPYRVFHKFFKYKTLEEWELTQQEVLEYALSRWTDRTKINSLEIYLHFTSLIEAMHLIDLRETTHVDGLLKSSFLD